MTASIALTALLVSLFSLAACRGSESNESSVKDTGVTSLTAVPKFAALKCMSMDINGVQTHATSTMRDSDIIVGPGRQYLVAEWTQSDLHISVNCALFDSSAQIIPSDMGKPYCALRAEKGFSSFLDSTVFPVGYTADKWAIYPKQLFATGLYYDDGSSFLSVNCSF